VVTIYIIINPQAFPQSFYHQLIDWISLAELTSSNYVNFFLIQCYKNASTTAIDQTLAGRRNPIPPKFSIPQNGCLKCCTMGNNFIEINIFQGSLLSKKSRQICCIFGILVQPPTRTMQSISVLLSFEFLMTF
jgi:hypothetical protein